MSKPLLQEKVGIFGHARVTVGGRLDPGRGLINLPAPDRTNLLGGHFTTSKLSRSLIFKEQPLENAPMSVFPACNISKMVSMRTTNRKPSTILQSSPPILDVPDEWTESLAKA